MNNNAPNKRNLTLRYVFALLLIALLSLSTYVAISFIISQQNSDALVINLSGRQRMLSQKLTKEVLLLAQQQNPQAHAQIRESLVETLGSWQRVHEGLQQGDVQLNLPGNNSADIQLLFEKMDPHFYTMVDATSRILKLNYGQSPSTQKQLVETVVVTSPLYLGWMDKAVFQYGQEAQNRVVFLKNSEALIVVAMLFVLLLEVLFIFRPMVRSVSYSYRCLQRKGDELQQELIKQKQLEKQLRESGEQLRQSQKMESLGILAGGIAHDFNNILGIISGNAELIQMALAETSQEVKRAEVILKVSARGANLVKQILTFSRMEPQPLVPMGIAPVVNEAISMLRATLPADIEMYYEVEDVRGNIMADEVQIQQVIINLVTNAVQSMKEQNGTIKVRLEEVDAGSLLMLTVSDDGCGISAEDKENIFDPFFTTKEIGKGTGLGLAVVHGIVKNHQGEITVTSDEGKGTTFTIYLPVVHEVEISGKTNEKELVSDSGGVEGKQILIVEDEQNMLDLYQEMLENQGYGVTKCHNGADALALFKQNPEHYDLVLTDQAMPKMTGGQLSQEILKIHPNIPIVLLTGFSRSLSEEKAKSLGIRRYLAKPVKLNELCQAIKVLL